MALVVVAVVHIRISSSEGLIGQMGMMGLPFLGRVEEGQTRIVEVGQTKIEVVVVALLSTFSCERCGQDEDLLLLLCCCCHSFVD
jgi:hypothetical protein